MLQKQKIVHLFYGKTRRKKGKQKQIEIEKYTQILNQDL